MPSDAKGQRFRMRSTKRFSADVRVRNSNPRRTQVCGIELSCQRSEKIGWSIAEYLTSLDQKSRRTSNRSAATRQGNELCYSDVLHGTLFQTADCIRKSREYSISPNSRRTKSVPSSRMSRRVSQRFQACLALDMRNWCGSRVGYSRHCFQPGCRRGRRDPAGRTLRICIRGR